MFGDNTFWDGFGNTEEGVGGAILSGAGGIVDTAANIKGVPGLGSVISGMGALYHANAAVYSGMNGNRDNAVGHGAQAVVNGIAAIPAAGTAMGIADGVLAHAGGGARWANDKFGLGIPEEAMPMSLAEGASNLAIGATNLVFGQEDMTNNKGSRHGEVAAGIAGMATGPFGAIDMVAGTDICGTIGTMGADFFGSTKEEGTVGGKDANPNAAAEGGAAAHEYFKKAVQNGSDPRANPTPMVPKPVTTGSGGTGAGPTKTGAGPTSDGSPYGGGHAGANTKAGQTSSFSTGPGPHAAGSPGIQPGPADGSVTPGIDHQLIGPGGLLTPPPAAPAGPMPYGVQPKGNGAPMSGPMPKLPWFLEPAGPSTW